jgi:flagellar hook-length control protein FliK
MTMDVALALSAMTTNAQAQQPAAAGQEAQAAPAAGQFGRMLVARVSEAGGANRPNAQTQGSLPVAWNLSGGEWADLLGGSNGESLFDKLDELLRLTENGGTLTQAQQAEIDAALGELQALMMALFGIPLPIEESITATGQQADIAAEAEADAGASEAPAVRGGLHETLAFVRSFLAEGAFRPLTKQENALFESLIGRLQRALAATDEAAHLDGSAEQQPQAEARATGVEIRLSAEALLARLARGPMQASVAAVVTETQHLEAARSVEAQNALQTGASAPVQGLQAQSTSGDAAMAFAADSAETLPVAQTVQPTTANAAPLAARTEAPVRQPVPSVPVERFHEIVSDMAVRHFRMSASNGVSEARILLVPEHLGEVAVRITLQNGQLTAQFVTESAAARELIENQFVMLRGVLQSHGIQVDRLEATQGNAAAQSQLFQEQRQRGGQDRHEGQRGKRGEDSLPVFESELLEQAAIRELGYGRAINVKA